MKVTLHLEGTRQEMMDQMDEFRTLLTTSVENQPPKDAAKKSTKKAAPEKEEEFSFGEDEAAEGELETALDMNLDVVPAFARFAKSDKPRSEKKAIAILKHYGVRSVRDIPEEKWAEVLERLK